MNNGRYWSKRLAKQNDINYNRQVEAVEKKLTKLYSQTAHNVVVDIGSMLDRINKPVEEILPNDLYRNNRYFELLGQINYYLNQLGEKEIEIFDEEFMKMYEFSYSLVGNSSEFTLSMKDSAKRVIDAVWCQDGLHWSDRVWKNKKIMQSVLEQGLTDCLARGISKDKLIGEMARLTGAQRYQADRILRTELTYIQNQAAGDSYEKAGVEQYEYLAAIDDRTSKICQSTNGKKFFFKDKKVGVNYPPLHPFVVALLFRWLVVVQNNKPQFEKFEG